MQNRLLDLLCSSTCISAVPYTHSCYSAACIQALTGITSEQFLELRLAALSGSRGFAVAIGRTRRTRLYRHCCLAVAVVVAVQKQHSANMTRPDCSFTFERPVADTFADARKLEQ